MKSRHSLQFSSSDAALLPLRWSRSGAGLQLWSTTREHSYQARWRHRCRDFVFDRGDARVAGDRVGGPARRLVRPLAVDIPEGGINLAIGCAPNRGRDRRTPGSED